MSMKRTWPISSSISFLTSVDTVNYLATCPVQWEKCIRSNFYKLDWRRLEQFWAGKARPASPMASYLRIAGTGRRVANWCLIGSANGLRSWNPYQPCFALSCGRRAL